VEVVFSLAFQVLTHLRCLRWIITSPVAHVVEWPTAEPLRLGEDDDDEEPEYVQFKADIPVCLGSFLSLHTRRVMMHLDPKKFGASL